MSVYVDELMVCLRNKYWPYNRSCHLMADSVEELHVFARRLGLKSSWFQSKSDLPHYDLSDRKRPQAVRLGAIEIDRKKISELMKKNRSRRAGP